MSSMSSVLLNVRFPAVKDKSEDGWGVEPHRRVGVGVGVEEAG